MKFKQEKKKMLGERQLVYFGANIFFFFFHFTFEKFVLTVENGQIHRA